MEKDIKYQIRGTAGKIEDGELKIESQGKTKWKQIFKKREKEVTKPVKDNKDLNKEETAQKELEEDEEIIR